MSDKGTVDTSNCAVTGSGMNAERDAVRLVSDAMDLLGRAMDRLGHRPFAIGDLRGARGKLLTLMVGLAPGLASFSGKFPLAEVASCHESIMEMVTVLIDALGPHAVTLDQWLDDPDRFELWHGTSGDAAFRAEQAKRLESIALAYGYLSALAAVSGETIATIIEHHRIQESAGF